MFTATEVSTTNPLSPEEVQILDNSLDHLLENYRLNHNVLKLEWITPILGNPPIIPDSPDSDTRMDAWEARAEYGRKAEFIEDLLKRKSE